MRRVFQLGSAAAVLVLCWAGAQAAGPEAIEAQPAPAEASAPQPPPLEAPVNPPGSPPMTSQAPPSTPRAPGRMTPLMQDIQSLVEQERVAVEALRLRLAQATDAAERLQLQREVERTKRESLWSILEVQIRYARAEGRTNVVEELEHALTIAKDTAAAAQLPVMLPPSAEQSNPAHEQR